jgi:hypothetical protein
MKRSIWKINEMVIAVPLLVLLFLPSCTPLDWVKKKLGVNNPTVQPSQVDSGGSTNYSSEGDGSAVLARMDGKPIITLDVFQREFDDFVDKNRLRPLIQFMPDAKEKFLDGLVSQHVIDRDIKDRGIDKKSEYKKEIEQIIKSAHQMLNTKYFAEMYPVKVSEADLKAFYEQNKERLPDILIARGGVNALGIDFSKDADAQAFFNKVKNNPKDFSAVAKEMQMEGKIKSFDLITEQSPGIDPMVREKIILYEKFPTIEVIKTKDNACWVIYAKEKKEAECRPFEQVKATVEQYVMREKRMEVLEKEINVLRNKYKVTIDKSAFGSQNKNIPQISEEDMQGLEEEIEQEPAGAQAL